MSSDKFRNNHALIHVREIGHIYNPEFLYSIPIDLALVLIMTPDDDTTTVPFQENEEDEIQILDGKQRKKYLSDITSSQKSQNLFKRALLKLLNTLKI